MAAQRREEEARRRVLPLLDRYAAGTLPPTVAFLFEVHRNRCPTCGAYLRTLSSGPRAPLPPPGLLEHIGDFSFRSA